MRVIQCPEAASRGEDQAPHRPQEALFLTTLMVLHVSVSSSSGTVIVLMKNTSSILAGYHFYKWANGSISSIRTLVVAIRIARMLTHVVDQCIQPSFHSLASQHGGLPEVLLHQPFASFVKGRRMLFEFATASTTNQKRSFGTLCTSCTETVAQLSSTSHSTVVTQISCGRTDALVLHWTYAYYSTYGP